jgi:hypothetical protein
MLIAAGLGGPGQIRCSFRDSSIRGEQLSYRTTGSATFPGLRQVIDREVRTRTRATEPVPVGRAP